MEDPRQPPRGDAPGCVVTPGTIASVSLVVCALGAVIAWRSAPAVTAPREWLLDCFYDVDVLGGLASQVVLLFVVDIPIRVGLLCVAPGPRRRV